MVGKWSIVTFRLTLGILLLLNSGVTFAQLATSAEKSAFRNIEKHRWQKAEAKLRKALRKDPVNASLRYVLSAFYFRPDNPAYDLDSAYHYAVTALDDYTLTAGRERDRLQRIPLDSIGLLTLRGKIDSAAFQVAENINTEEGYIHFLSHFPLAAQRGLALELRDEVAYLDALKQNTYQAFYSFLERYPEAKRATDARAHYDRLLYLDSTRDRRLNSYVNFLTGHPETPYRAEIYQHIFEISTADGKAESFFDFMGQYPESGLLKKASKLAFHILAEEDNPAWPEGFLTDSLQDLLALNKVFLIPVLKNNRYGFMDENGREVLAPRFDSIHPDYLCGHISEDVLVADNKLIARNGSLIYNDSVDELNQTGAGFLKISSRGRVRLIHKGGFAVADSLQDARVLSRAFLALKKFDSWFLYTLTGKLLDANPWDDILAFKDVIVFKTGKKVFMTRKDQLGKIANGNSLELSAAFDDVKFWPHDLIWVKLGELQGVLDQSLQSVVSLDKQKLTQAFFGISAEGPGGFALYNWLGQKASGFSAVNVSGQWVAVKRRNAWLLFDPRFRQVESKPYDTIRVEGPFVIGQRTDTVYVHFTGNRIRMFTRPITVSFIPGMDTTSFLLVQDEKQKTLYDLRGKKLFFADFDAIGYAGEGIFVITRKDKKGLINASGQNVLPADFDAIGSVQGQVVSLLRNKRFGAYNIRDKKLIKPQYDRNLYPYTQNLLTTFHDGFYGFLGWDNKPAGKFEFDEITYWNDSVALVRKGAYWNLYDIAEAKIRGGNLRSISMVKNTAEEKIAIVQRENNFGVISNRRDVIVPISFSDVINLGSAEAPLYFTEKQVKEASLFVVIYYDRYGNIMRKEIYEEPAEYDRIYCSDN